MINKKLPFQVYIGFASVYCVPALPAMNVLPKLSADEEMEDRERGAFEFLEEEKRIARKGVICTLGSRDP